MSADELSLNLVGCKLLNRYTGTDIKPSLSVKESARDDKRRGNAVHLISLIETV